LNIRGVAFSFQVTVFVTIAALTCLIVYWGSALPRFDFSGSALDIGPDGAWLAGGGGPLLPFGVSGALAALPFAVWLFLAIEQLPLAAEESLAPQRDIPRGIVAGLLTLILSAFLILFLNPGIAGVGSWALGQSSEPLLDGFRAIYGTGTAKFLALIAVVGLVASFHTIIFAEGRQIYSLSRAGYFPTFLSLTHGERKTPHVAMIAGAVVGIGVMLAVWFLVGVERGTAIIGGTLLNMAVFGAMFSYIMQAASFLLLRRDQPDMERPYRSPLGSAGAYLTIAIAVVTLGYQLSDATYRAGVLGVAVWFLLGAGYFHFFRRHRLVLSPEEEFAVRRKP
ncbi:MAG TPA: amino acid permease, partial [Pseudomonadales bacterium]